MRLEQISSLDAARPAWESLEHATGNVFSTWEWADAWWQVYGEGRELALHAVRDGDRVAAILPLYRADRGPIAVLRLIGHGAGDELGPVCHPDDAELAAEALQELARDLFPGGAVLVDRVRGDVPLRRCLRGSVVRVEPSPILEPGGLTWDEWLAGRSSSFRREHRRRERRLIEDHGFHVRQADDVDQVDEAMSVMVDLHHARWDGQPTTAFAPERERLHRDFARRAARRGWLRLLVAEAGGRPVGACYAMRFAGTEFFYQCGRDPEWERHGVGTALFYHGVRQAFHEGMEVLRFGVGDEDYKLRYATADPGVRTLVVGPAATRRAAAAAVRGIRRLPPALRRPLARRVA